MNAPVSFLSEVALFNSLSIATLENLSSAGRIHKYEKGNIICRKGDPALNFFVVLSGEVSEIVEDDNDFTTTSVLKGRGDYFGELGILLEETFATTAVAAGFAEIFVIPRQTASETLWNHRASMKQILRLFHRGLQNSASRFISCTNFNVEGRLAYNLLLMVPREGAGSLRPPRRTSPATAAFPGRPFPPF